MKCTMLGTGHAVVTQCYNTCFVLSEQDEHFLVDGGGGGTLLRQLKAAEIPWQNIHTIFVTHKHTDHLLGILWMIRLHLQMMSRGKITAETTIYSHQEVIDLLTSFSLQLFNEHELKPLGKQLHLVAIEDGQEKTILHRKTTFFDLHAEKEKQFGFTMQIDENKRLTCCGDEPCSSLNYPYVQNSEWLMHEAFCLYEDRHIFKPYEKHHSTVKDAAELAEQLNVNQLILYHTEDTDLSHRKQRYTQEASQVYSKTIHVPDDLDVLPLFPVE